MPVITRLTELTPFETASNVAPNPALYPKATEYSAKNVNGRPFPPACRNPAPILNKNDGFVASLISMCVGLLPTNLEGAAVTVIGKPTTSTKKARARNVHLGPMEESKARMMGEKTSPPIPAPERIKPIADPR
jgi:hypothetical protein